MFFFPFSLLADVHTPKTRKEKKYLYPLRISLEEWANSFCGQLTLGQGCVVGRTLPPHELLVSRDLWKKNKNFFLSFSTDHRRVSCSSSCGFNIEIHFNRARESPYYLIHPPTTSRQQQQQQQQPNLENSLRVIRTQNNDDQLISNRFVEAIKRITKIETMIEIYNFFLRGREDWTARFGGRFKRSRYESSSCIGV